MTRRLKDDEGIRLEPTTVRLSLIQMKNIHVVLLLITLHLIKSNFRFRFGPRFSKLFWSWSSPRFSKLWTNLVLVHIYVVLLLITLHLIKSQFVKSIKNHSETWVYELTLVLSTHSDSSVVSLRLVPREKDKRRLRFEYFESQIQREI